MNNILQQYYQGITQQLRSEVDFINTIFHHQGVKGEGNEGVLRDLIKRFIPKKYGVGTGIVIDRKGNQSRQCDIVIYDNFLYPSLLSMATVHLFPVDIVYATIEIKTTLDSNSVKEALDNIASVKNLDIIQDSFGITEYTSGPEASAVMSLCHPTSPVGSIFSYNSQALKIETFKKWFISQEIRSRSKFPNLVSCLDQGMIIVPMNNHPANTKPNYVTMPLYDENSFIQFDERPENSVYNHQNFIYPVKQIKHQDKDVYIPIDQSRVLLCFVLFLNELLNKKRLNPSISFIDSYLDSTMKSVYPV